MTTTSIAPAFPFTTRRTTTTLDEVPDDTWGFATATITTTKPHGTGSSLRMTLGLTADNGATAVATLNADKFRQTPDFLRTPGVEVEIRGLVQHRPGMPTVIDVAGIDLARRSHGETN